MVQINWFARQKERHRCREQMYGHQRGKVGERGGGEMNWEIGIDIYSYKKNHYGRLVKPNKITSSGENLQPSLDKNNQLKHLP